MKTKSSKKIELLAPAGTIEVFEAAIKNGADAVYVGAPFMNARALAQNFTLSEISAMADYAHSRRVKIYIAMNSLLKDIEIRELIKTLAVLQEIRVDALIIQDIGILNLVKKYFPNFRIHASTLCTVHNSLGVEQYDKLGVDRVVLAREMSINEISQVKKRTKVELEIFIHGAMCFAYSGQCYFSSFLGGKSGLRGRCVQPCRRLYSWHKKGQGRGSGYLFSMNDLEGIDLIPQFINAGVTSLKIEGRMKSSHYVGSVVNAYRLVLDAKPGEKKAYVLAKELLSNAMGRKSSAGYFKSVNNSHLISPHHSGNIGLYLGKIVIGGKSLGTIIIKEDIKTGDRFRVHLEKTGERHAFTLKKILLRGNLIDHASSGEKIEIELPVKTFQGDSLYKVSTKEARSVDNRKSKIGTNLYRKKIVTGKYKNFINSVVNDINAYGKKTNRRASKKNRFSYEKATRGRRSNQRSFFPLPWWLKVDEYKALKMLNGPNPDRLLFSLTTETISQISQLISIKRRYKKCIFSLPTIIEEKDIDIFGKGIENLLSKGAKEWQIGHIGQLSYFPFRREKSIRIYADNSFNVLNSLAVNQLRDLNFAGTQLSIEADKDCLSEICKNSMGLKIGTTVYGLPALFTARPRLRNFQFDNTFISPKGEKFVLKKNSGQTVVVPDKPLSLIPWLIDLAEIGIDYIVVDITNMNVSRGLIPALVQKGGGKKRRERSSSFNYRGKLY